MVLKDCLAFFKIVTGFLNKLPVAKLNAVALEKFLACVNGPNTVFAT